MRGSALVLEAIVAWVRSLAFVNARSSTIHSEARTRPFADVINSCVCAAGPVTGRSSPRLGAGTYSGCWIQTLTDAHLHHPLLRMQLHGIRVPRRMRQQLLDDMEKHHNLAFPVSRLFRPRRASYLQSRKRRSSPVLSPPDTLPQTTKALRMFAVVSCNV